MDGASGTSLQSSLTAASGSASTMRSFSVLAVQDLRRDKIAIRVVSRQLGADRHGLLHAIHLDLGRSVVEHLVFVDLGSHEFDSLGAASAISLAVVHHAAEGSGVALVVFVIVGLFQVLLISSHSAEVAQGLLLEILLFELVVLQDGEESSGFELKSTSLGCLDAPFAEVGVLQFLFVSLGGEADSGRLFGVGVSGLLSPLGGASSIATTSGGDIVVGIRWDSDVNRL